ncbi:hypothetical protein ACRAWD_22995 [Caulobacter segnis]
MLLAAPPSLAQTRDPEVTWTRADDTRRIDFPATVKGGQVLAIDTHSTRPVQRRRGLADHAGMGGRAGPPGRLCSHRPPGSSPLRLADVATRTTITAHTPSRPRRPCGSARGSSRSPALRSPAACLGAISTRCS